MQLFADYVQPFTGWLYLHPYWALAITFLVSFSESLAIVGSIVPGSVTMTAIGILAGSGVMRIDLTLLAAISGAVMGDSVSYFLGYYFSDRMPNIWPFRRYPQVLAYGKQYFVQHGGKSVLIGRFAGPLRAIIPVIAGMMRMNQRRFLIANIISAVGWSILYVIPGVLIGAASSDLSAEVATRLFLVILAAIFIFWMVGFLLRWLIQSINNFLEKHFHYFWAFTARHPNLEALIRYITPQEEKNHYHTVFLILSIVLSLSALIVTLIFIGSGTWLIELNTILHYFFNSLRSNMFDYIFTVISFFYSPLVLLVIGIVVSVLALRFNKIRLLGYWILALSSTLLFCGVLNNLVNSPHPSGNTLSHTGSSFPATSLAIMIVMLTFSSLLVRHNTTSGFTYLYRYFSLIILTLAGFSALYLGDYWFSDVIAAIFIGLFCCLTTYLFYRRAPNNKAIRGSWIAFIILCWSLGAIAESFFHLQASMLAHKIVFPQKTIAHFFWKNQLKDTLPRYRNNRLGLPIDLFNVQYLGSLMTIEDQLSALGWERVSKSFWTVVLEKMKASDNSFRLPILTQLYLNKKPHLIMVKKYKQHYFIFRFWESSYRVEPSKQRLYFATLHLHRDSKKTTIKHKELNQILSTILKPLRERASISTMKIETNAVKQRYSNIYLIQERI